MTRQQFLAMIAWATLAGICFVTLAPIGMRPGTGTGHVASERFAAYALLGTLFMVAYPRHFVAVAILLVATGLGLEALQHLTPDRHGRLLDAFEKIAGAIAGCSLTRLAQILTADWNS